MAGVIFLIICVAVIILLPKLFVKREPVFEGKKIGGVFAVPLGQLIMMTVLFLGALEMDPEKLLGIPDWLLSESNAKWNMEVMQSAIGSMSESQKELMGTMTAYKGVISLSFIVVLFSSGYYLYKLFFRVGMTKRKFNIPVIVGTVACLLSSLMMIPYFNATTKYMAEELETPSNSVVGYVICLFFVFVVVIMVYYYLKTIDIVLQVQPSVTTSNASLFNHIPSASHFSSPGAKPMKTCPYCGEEILAVAVKCKHCGEWLNKEPEAPKKMINCPICGEEVEEGLSTCPHCKEPIEQKEQVELFPCPICGEKIPVGSTVCPYCNEPLVDIKQNIPNPECGGMIQPDGETQQEDGPKAIDLGLSVLWAVCNIGGDVDSPIGGLYGWGDPTGEQTSKDANDYIEKTSGQCDKTPQDISGTQNDIATAMWGEGWRMPNRANWEELIANCKWTKCSVLNAVGYRVEGPNGNSIFLPNTGLRLGDDVSKTDAGYYWTSEMAEGNSGCAYSYYFDLEKYSDVVSTKSYVYSGRAVRPVHEKVK